MDLTYVKLLLLLASLWGYMLLIGKKGMEIAFAPALTVSGIGIAMFLAGILNVMPQTAAVIFLGGLLLLGYGLKTWGKPDTHTLAVLSFFSLFVFVLGILYRNVVFVGPDDFSHWALTVKNLLMNDRLPRQGDIIYYQNYPTGSAGFVYFVCKILGHSEPNMLRGQAIIILSSLCFLWANVKRRYAFSGVLITLFSLFLILSLGGVRNMLVDLILTLLGTTAFLLLVYYRRDVKKASFGCCILLSYLAVVKNSSFFFIVLHALPALYFARAAAKAEGRRPSPRTYGTVLCFQAALPFAAYYLWDRHVSYAFEAGNMTRHSLSLPYLMQTFSEKSLSDIWAIFVRFVYRTLQVGAEIPSFLVVLAVLFLGLLLHYRKTKTLRCPELWYLMWGLITFGTYMLSLLGMYLFSMPYAEAIILGSYTRYVTTIATYLLCICFVHLLDQISTADTLPAVPAAAAGLTALSMLLSVLTYAPSLTRNIPFKSDAREILTQLREEYQIPGSSSYYIICDSWDVYVRFVARYDFWTGNVFVEHDPLNPTEPDALDWCDHLILLRQGGDVDQFLETLGLPLGQSHYYLPHYR